MPSYQAAQFIQPFGKRVHLRSTTPAPQTESYTCSSVDMPANQTIDGNPVKVLQPGTVMARITSGTQAGMVGVFQAGATDGRQDTANIVGINLTFLPWTLNERDVEIAVTYDSTHYLAKCVEHDAAGAETPLTVPVADAMRNTISLDLKFV